MYLLPTDEEINRLYRQINPTAQIMDFLYSRPPAEGSMAEFFLESEDVDLVMEDDAMPYFDEIEDDIIFMRRDIYGKRAPWYLSDYSKGTDSVRYKGKSLEYIPNEMKFPDGPGVEHASCWDEI